jgi:uncharacterized membrane protein
MSDHPSPPGAIADPNRLLFDAVLHPHRSLGPRGFYLLIGFIALVSFATGVAFALKGAWPILGFFGLDVLAIYFALRLSYRSGRLHETVQLRENELTVRRILPNGRAAGWTFNPYWVRIALHEGRLGDGHVELTSHGHRVFVGRFLTAGERADFAAALGNAVGRLKSHHTLGA